MHSHSHCLIFHQHINVVTIHSFNEHTGFLVSDQEARQHPVECAKECFAGGQAPNRLWYVQGPVAAGEQLVVAVCVCSRAAGVCPKGPECKVLWRQLQLLARKAFRGGVLQEAAGRCLERSQGMSADTGEGGRAGPRAAGSPLHSGRVA